MTAPNLALLTTAAVGVGLLPPVRHLLARLCDGLLVAVVLLGVTGLFGGTAYIALKVALHDHPLLTVLAGLALLLALAVDLGRRVRIAGATAVPAPDDEDGGGGGEGPVRGPEEPTPPGGQVADWDAFDEQRRAWERAAEPARERELVGV